MQSAFLNTKNLFKALVLLAIVATSFAISQSSLITADPLIATAVTIDLLLTLPLVYLFFICKTAVSKLTVVPVFGAAAFLASMILPANDRYLLDLAITYALPVLELVFLVYAGVIVVRARTAFRSQTGTPYDVLEKLRRVLSEHISPALFGRVLAFETGAIYFALFKWKKRPPGANTFTYHKRPGAVLLIAVFISLLAIETTVIHIVLTRWSATAAWVLTALSLYFALQLFAHAKAIILRPIEVLDDRIMVRCGLLGDAEININDIVSIEMNEACDKALVFSPIGKLAPPNVKITLAKPAVLNGFYGLWRSISVLSFTVDEFEIFFRRIKNKV